MPCLPHIQRQGKSFLILQRWISSRRALVPTHTCKNTHTHTQTFSLSHSLAHACTHTHIHTHTLTHSLSCTLPHALPHSLNLLYNHSLSCILTHSFAYLLTLIYTLMHTHSLSLSLTLTIYLFFKRLEIPQKTVNFRSSSLHEALLQSFRFLTCHMPVSLRKLLY